MHSITYTQFFFHFTLSLVNIEIQQHISLDKLIPNIVLFSSLITRTMQQIILAKIITGTKMNYKVRLW